MTEKLVWRPEDVDCPYCLEKVGHRCRTLQNDEVTYWHAGRLYRANMLTRRSK